MEETVTACLELPIMWAMPPEFRGKNFTDGPKITKFAKVFHPQKFSNMKNTLYVPAHTCVCNGRVRLQLNMKLSMKLSTMQHVVVHTKASHYMIVI